MIVIVKPEETKVKLYQPPPIVINLAGPGPAGAGGGGSSDAVLYVAQSLTTPQKTQARTNIDAASVAALAAEATERAGADAALGSEIDDETAERIAADAALNSAIILRATTAALNAEITARTDADTALANDIAGKADAFHTHFLSHITDMTPAGRDLASAANEAAQRAELELGTAATRNVPASGNASASECVLGGDTRLGLPTLYRLADDALSAQIPDNTVANGNARGVRAVDLQQRRYVSSQVASGQEAVVMGGAHNTANGLYAATVAGGEDNTASGMYSFVGGGAGSVANAPFAVAFGQSSHALGIVGAFTHTGAPRSARGDNQRLELVLQLTTSGATPSILTADRSSASVSNTLAPRNNSAISGTVNVIAHDHAANLVASWLFHFTASRGASASTVALKNHQLLSSFTTDMPSASCALVANVTRGSIDVQVTGAAATEIDWTAIVCVVINNR